ncbi:hypothetical protein ACWEN6_13545 [Sphaerisporangium sp. NPDC004334]
MSDVELNLHINVATFTEATRHVYVGALDAATAHLLTESRARVPVQYGDLYRSGAASVDDRLLMGAVSYDQPYAVRQHEELTYHHTQGEAKYLENALLEEADTLEAIIAAHLRVHFR